MDGSFRNLPALLRNVRQGTATAKSLETGHLAEAKRRKKGEARLLMALLPLALGACSSLIPPTDPAATAMVDRATANGSAPEVNAQVSSDIEGPRRQSEYVRKNRRLFSKAQDERPIPAPDSAEWKQMKADEARRDKELQKAIQICRC